MGSKDFDEGLALGSRVATRHATAAVAGALLDILGKDLGDGIINLGAAGYWRSDSTVFPGRWIQAGVGEDYDYRREVPEDVGPLNYRAGISGGSK